MVQNLMVRIVQAILIGQFIAMKIMAGVAIQMATKMHNCQPNMILLRIQNVWNKAVNLHHHCDV